MDLSASRKQTHKSRHRRQGQGKIERRGGWSRQSATPNHPLHTGALGGGFGVVDWRPRLPPPFDFDL
ncbi:hypothetical protein CRG98_021140 [Punica granatum]|uniref:Uncharacterized protein n=1 Tax=Punica granatum TaxID=22663 RepID=A0A2I0JQ91_PUNGR|nr:hypothetical protein CRG98_021140 [Punica granatum]